MTGRSLRSRIGAALCLLLMLTAALACPGAGGETTEEPETVTGYFATNKYLRPAMVPSSDIVDTIPAWTVVTVRMVQDLWGEATSEKGLTGYIHIGEMLPLPEPVPCEAWIGYCEERQALRSLPESGQKDERRIQAREAVTVDGEYGDYYHVSLANGETGYVLKKVVLTAEFTPKQLTPFRFCVGEAAGALAMPLTGAEEVLTLSVDAVYEASEAWGDFYALPAEDGSRAWVWKGNVRIWSADEEEPGSFFRAPGSSGKSSGVTEEEIYHKARVREGGTVMYTAGGGERQLAAGENVYVYLAYGGFCGVSSRKAFGYIRRGELEINANDQTDLTKTDLSGATITRNDFLDQALPLLEAGNSFLLRYNAITGAKLEPLFPLGVPYFWGGRGYNILTERYPEYTTREAWQSSINYYVKGEVYVFGFDCIGLVKHVYKAAGHPIENVSELEEPEWCEEHHVFCSRNYPAPEDWAEAAKSMEIGDLVWVRYPGVHALMYIGTLRDYGYTPEQLPALADFLDYPLMIQSGANPYCYFRFRNLLAEQKTGRLADAIPPDGGASICILGPRAEDAEMVIDYLYTSKPCFEVEGTCVTIFNFDHVTRYFIYRDSPLGRATEEPEPTEEPGEAGEPAETEEPSETEEQKETGEPEKTEEPEPTEEPGETAETEEP